MTEEPRNTGKESLLKSFTDLEKATIVQEVTDTFTQLIEAINRKDAAAWEIFYSKQAFVSAAAGGDVFPTRTDWVQAITSNFSMRERQQVEVHSVQVIPLASDTALLTSRESATMKLNSGESSRSRHVFTMIWKKENEGWRILHSHESWVDEPIR